jgi:type I restriction enzyme S subunit
MTLADAIHRRFPLATEASKRLRQHLEDACLRFLEADHDGTALAKICSHNDNQYWQQLSEVLIGVQLERGGIPFIHPKSGPDFLLAHEGRRIWVEVVCPEARDIPEEWTHHTPGSAVSLPHEALLLRWTAAIKEKAEKLLGGPRSAGYLKKKVVGPEDVYVIAVNGRLLRGFQGVFPELSGISQYPYAVEATLALGPLQVQIRRDTMKATETGYQHRPSILKVGGSAVPADSFFDPRFRPISAIWAVDLDEAGLVGKYNPKAVVHNPMAFNPLPKRFLPAGAEYFAVDCGDHFELHTDKRDAAVVSNEMRA